MKKYLLPLLFVTSLAYAGVPDPRAAALYLQITIKNNTPSTCVVVQQTLKSGTYSCSVADYDAPPPEYTTIPAGETTPPFYIFQTNFTGPDLVLSYDCGEGRFITIESQKNTALAGGDITGSISSIANMNATSTITLGRFWAKKPGTISWTFN